MFRAKPETRRNLTVTAICSDAATLDGLEGYLNRRVSFRCFRAIHRAGKESMAADCVVLYPDGFPPRAVQRLAKNLTSAPTVSLVIIVTARPAEYQALDRARTANSRLIVLSLPAWPWTLFATIQSSLPSLRREASRLC
ncbi:MAG TPA: hypothetical protein VGC79_16345 [Polyangiaceae bacterium]